MKQVQYVKYNKMRREAFQIKTQIVWENGVRYVEKIAIRPEGGAHIRRFVQSYEQLSRIFTRVTFLKPELTGEGMRYDYLTGDTLDERLAGRIAAGEKPEAVLGDALAELLSVKEGSLAPFEKTDRFTEVFGTVKTMEDQALPISNIDMLFENIMIEPGDRWVCMDYEWVFDFPVPVNYVRYRTLVYFYRKHENLFAGRLDQTGLLERCGITRPMAIQFMKMEKGFQAYVHGEENAYIYTNRYVKAVKPFEKTIYEYENTIEGLHTAVQLKENHIQNLTAMIAAQDAALHKYDGVKRIAKKLGAKPVYHGMKTVYKAGKKLLHGDAEAEMEAGSGVGSGDAGGAGTAGAGASGRSSGDAAQSAGNTRPVPRIGVLPDDPKQREKVLRKWTADLRFACVEHPRVSIIIPVYNQIDYTIQCLRSILANTADVTYEIIIADDRSTDETVRLTSLVKGIQVQRTPQNSGFLLNCNHAARHARGQYVLFLNNDTEVRPGWLSSLVTLIESDPTIGMVGSKFIYPDGRLNEAGGILWSNGTGWNYGRFDDPAKAAYNFVRDVDYISGASILLSRRLWEQLGGFDERFAPAYCEDADLAFAVRDAGYRVVYQPLSEVIHYEGVSNGTDLNSGMKRYQVENFKKLREKWAEEFSLQTDYSDPPCLFPARERHYGKKTVLVIDHYVPTYDKDAGSRSTFQFIQMFIHHGYTVKFIGDNFNHEEPYTTTLLQMGVEVLYGDEFRDGRILNWIEANQEWIDFAFMNRPHITAKYIDFIREHTNIKCIYYGHDLHFLREMREYELTRDPKRKEDSDHWRKQEFAIMHKAAAVYYPSTMEVEAIKAADPSIPVKAVSVYNYDTFRNEAEIPRNFQARTGFMFIGGFAHRPNVDAVQWFVKEIYPAVKKALGNVPFYIAGSRPPREITELDGTDGAGNPGAIVVKGFVSDEELQRLYDTCRLVVCPLRFGAGVKGKVIESVYNGIPMITTSIGAEGIPEIRSVVAVEDEAEAFAEKTIAMYQDTEGLKDISVRSQVYIKEYFSQDAQWRTVEEDFQ